VEQHRPAEIGPARSLVLVFFTFLTLTLVQVAIPLRLEQLGFGTILIGCLLALPSLTGLLTEAPFAALSDAAGRRVVISIGAVLIVGAAVILGLTVSPWLFAIALLVYGTGLGAQTSSLMAALSESVPLRWSAHVQGWNGAVQRVGALGVAGLLTLTSEPVTLLWFVGVAGVACFALTVVVPVWHQLHAQRPHAFRTSIAAWGLLRRSRFVQVAAMNNIVLSMLFITTNSFVGLILVGNASTVALPALILARDGVSIVLALAFGPVAARVGWRTCFVAGMSSGTLGMLIGVLAPSDSLWLVATFALAGVAIGFGIAGANLTVTLGTAPTERATGMVAAGYAGRLTSLLAPIVLALALSHLAGPGVFGVAFVITAAASARAAWLLHRETQGGTLGGPVAPIQSIS